MTVDEIRAAYRAEPFQPFKIRLTDGREFAVSSRMCFGVDPTGQRLVVALPQDAFEIIDVSAVSAIQALGSAARRNGNSRGQRNPAGRAAKTTRNKKRQ